MVRFFGHCTVAVLLTTIGAPTASAQATHTLQVFLQGRLVGDETVTVTRSPTGWTIDATGRLGAPINLTTRVFQMRYDADWKPVELTVDALRGTAPLLLRTTFSGTTATNQITLDVKTTSESDVVSPDTIVLPNDYFSSFEALAARLNGRAAGEELPVYVVPQAEVRARVIAADTETMRTMSGRLETRRYHLTFLNVGRPVDVYVWADQDDRLVRLSIPSDSLEIAREDIASVSARSEAISHAGDEAVVIPASGFNLAGTLTKPVGDPRPKLPAVVLVAGSGPQDRDETVAGIPIFGQLANALADGGFLVVRYDKRGVGQSGGRLESVTLQDYTDDVAAVVKFLEKRPDVDAKRIALAGHAEGAWIAMLTAARVKDDVRALVLMSAPSTTGAELVFEQQRHFLELASTPEADKQAKIELQKKIHAAVSSGEGWEAIPVALRRQADTPWFRSFLAFDPSVVMTRVRQPLLIMHGDLDKEVLQKHADRLAELGRARKKAAPVEVVHVPGVNHLLVPATTGEVDEYPRLDNKHVSPAAITTIVGSLRQTMGRTPQ